MYYRLMKRISIRTLMTVLALAALALFFLLVFGAMTVLQNEFALLLPSNVVPQVIAGIQSLLMYQAVALGILAIIIAVTLYLVLIKAIA